VPNFQIESLDHLKKAFQNIIMKFYFGLLWIFCACTLHAAGKQPLYFQADKNGVKVIAQKFEYGLLDAEKIRLGDILIDSNTFNFQLNKKNNDYYLRFNWPAGLITEGQLSLLNNNGKAIWTTSFKKNQIKISPVQNDYPSLRSELAEYVSADPIKKEVVDTFRVIPFMTFCVSYRETNTRIYLCSRELYVSSADKNLEVKERKNSRRTASVEINGKSVGHQGIIFLNNSDENIFFRATAESSAYLEIDTRMKDVDFKDVVLSPDGENLIVTASGAEPVSQENLKILGNALWQTTIPADHPVFYLKADGGIPMRQEFVINGKVPKETSRVFIEGNPPQQTSSSSVSLDGIYPAGAKVKPGNKTDLVETKGKSQFEWTLRDLESGKINKRYLSVEADGARYFARYDILRANPYYLHAGASYDTPSGIAYGQLQIQWWLENFISSYQSALEAEFNIHGTKKEGYPEYDVYKLSYLYKFSPGFYLDNPTWGLSLFYSMVKGQDFSIGSPGLGFWGLLKPPGYFPKFVQWYRPYFNYLLGGTGNDVKMKSGMELGTTFYTQLKSSSFLTYGVRYLNYSFDPQFDQEKAQLGVDVGYTFKF
jgi:hypothetical protein